MVTPVSSEGQTAQWIPSTRERGLQAPAHPDKTPCTAVSGAHVCTTIRHTGGKRCQQLYGKCWIRAELISACLNRMRSNPQGNHVIYVMVLEEMYHDLI